MKNILIVLTSGLLLFTNCQSRDFKSVTVKDEVLSEVDPSRRQNLDEARAIIAKGNTAFNKSDFGEAVTLSKEANTKVETAEGYALLGAAEYRLGEYKSSKEAYILGDRLDPDNQKILIGLGTVQGTLGEYEESVITYQKLAKLNPEEPVYKYKIGTLLKLQRKFDESYVTLKPLEEEKDFPYPVELLNQLGDVCLELKKYDEAEAYFAKAEKLQPELKSAQNAKESTRVASFIQKGNDAIAKKNYDLAIVEYKKATELQPSNASLWSFLGNAYFLKGLYPEAETNFRKSISLQDNFTNAYIGLCNVYIKKKNFSECLKVSETGLAKSPRNADLKNKLGICEWKWGHTQKAVLSFQDASSWDKNLFEPRINLAYLLIDLGRNEEAIDALKKAESHIHADKDQIKKAIALAESQMYISEGDKFLRQGKRKQALEQYGKALGRSPSDPSPHNAFGKAYFVFDDSKKSESSYLESLRLDENNLVAMQGLARLYAKTGNAKKASEYVKKLQNLSQNDPYAAITMGRIAEDSKKYDEAESIYNGLAKKFPNHEAVNYRLANLFYKRAVDENEKENYTKALDFVLKSKKYSKEIPEVFDTERTIKENLRFAEIIPYVREGNKAYDKKRYDDAISAYQKAYDKINKPSLLVKIAECYMAKGEEERGISILEKAAKENKDQASSFQEGIFAYFYKKGETAKAEEGFNNLLKEKPDSFYSYYMLGLISMKKKDYEGSVNLFDKSILLNGTFAPSNVAKGVAYYKLEKKEDAKKEFERARNKDKEFSISSFNLAIAYFNEDLISESKSILETLRKSDPDFSEGEIQLAYIYFKEGRLDDAESAILNVLKEDRSAEALYAYFIILSEKNKLSPSEKTNSKRIALKKEIWKDHADTKYARMLPSDQPDGSVIITEVQLTGSPIQNPILYPNRMIINYGESLVGLDRNTKEVVWKIYTPEPYSKIIPTKQLLAVRPGLIQKIYPDTGKFSTAIKLANSEKIINAESFDDKIYILTENAKSNEKSFLVLSAEGNKLYESPDKDIASFGITSNGNLMFVRDKKKEFSFQSFPKDSFSATTKPSLLLKKDSKEQSNVIDCLSHACLVKVGGILLDVDISGKVVSLNMNGNYLNSYHSGNGIHVKSSESLLVWKEEGKWSEVHNSQSDFKYNIAETQLEAKPKEILTTKSSVKKSIPWNPERDNKHISTITLD